MVRNRSFRRLRAGCFHLYGGLTGLPRIVYVSVFLGFTALLLCSFVARCAVPLRDCDKAVPGRLVSAWEQKSRSSIALVGLVLEDSLNHTYCYDLSARDDAFDLVRDLEAVELAPMLRKVAAMEYKEDRDFQQTWDLVSIRRALIVLTQFRDSEAVRLNRSRLDSDSWLQSVAINNLAELQFWEATPEIVDLFNNIELKDEHRRVIVEAEDFLVQSSQPLPDVCSRLRAVAVAFGQCFSKPDAAPHCGKLVSSTLALQEKVGCGAPFGPPTER
jgi:hypothetical protein